MGKKSAAQIRRLQKRAEERGEEYVAPTTEERVEKEQDKTSKEAVKDETQTNEHPNKDDKKLEIAKRLAAELEAIENQGLKSKEKRSAKKRAAAIAFEESGTPAEELLEMAQANEKAETNEQGSGTQAQRRKRDPYIAFFGQLSFQTTKEGLFEYIKQEIVEHKITKDTVKIRLLTDRKTKSSKGMGFVEVDNPRLLHALLKLHHTYLDGRRLNVERTAGGRRSNENRKEKLRKQRDEQQQYIVSVVDAIFDEYYQKGEIRKGEVDDGVVEVCRHHSTTIVREALEAYVESSGGDKENPSAYLNFLLGKLAQERAESQIEERANNKRARKE